MHKSTTKISFNKEAIQRMTAEQFIERFSSVYPDADLHAYAKELGLISEPVADEAPAAIPPDENEEDIEMSDVKPKRGGKK